MRILVLFFMFSFSFFSKAQNKSIDEVLTRYNTRSVPYITVQELKMDYEKYLILDTRLQEEYEVSHLPRAMWVGNDNADNAFAKAQHDKQIPIVVYCSIGIRSEKFGEKLQKLGFTNVYNLYGSIFSWKDAGYTVFDTSGNITQEVHVYNKAWSSYLKTGKKIYKTQ